jgi:predicted CXXCH cytochrome family protein
MHGRVAASVLWEFAQLLGLCAVAACLIMCVLAVRPRGEGARPLRLAVHEMIGWLTLCAATGHVLFALGADSRALEHVKVTAPLYEGAGVLALLSLLFLTVPAGAWARRRLWPRHRSFQAAHVGAACLLVVTLAVHVVTTGRYVRGRQDVVIYTLLSCIALLALLRPRPSPRAAPSIPGAAPRLVFGRHSTLVLVAVLLALSVLLALMHAGSTLKLREPLVPRGVSLALDFPHEKHRSVNCIQCHHNFVDRSGQGSCIACHRSRSAGIQVGSEARFHDFCLGCHRDPPLHLMDHGPTTGCEVCHNSSQGDTSAPREHNAGSRSSESTGDRSSGPVAPDTSSPRVPPV